MKENILKPESVFRNFACINKVPRPSKREEKMIAFLLEFGKRLGLESVRDEAGNVLIRKPATPGMENRRTIVLQSHMDMVCEKNNDVDFNFDTDGIQTYIDGEWMKAKGTTLGADDGIGCAMEMAILADNSLKHGPLECVFTRDEETGLTGAEGMQPGFMTGQMLINLDSEDEGEIFVSCAGGCRTAVTFRFTPEAAPAGSFFLRLTIKGLTGGHSGDDIDKGRFNGVQQTARFLNEIWPLNVDLCHIVAGNKRNAIARGGEVVLAIPAHSEKEVMARFNNLAASLKAEYAVTDPGLYFHAEPVERPASAIDRATAGRVIRALLAIPHGVIAMSADIPGLIETSTNLASVRMDSGEKIVVGTMQRSAVDSQRIFLSQRVAAVLELAGAEVRHSDGYPGWKPNMNSHIKDVCVASYKRLFGREPVVRAIHAGLECGLFTEKFPDVDMIAFGPTLRGVHAPGERLDLASLERFWAVLLDVLKTI